MLLSGAVRTPNYLGPTTVGEAVCCAALGLIFDAVPIGPVASSQGWIAATQPAPTTFGHISSNCGMPANAECNKADSCPFNAPEREVFRLQRRCPKNFRLRPQSFQRSAHENRVPSAPSTTITTNQKNHELSTRQQNPAQRSRFRCNTGGTQRQINRLRNQIQTARRHI